MEQFRVLSCSDSLYTEAWDIYCDNFPHYERRTTTQMQSALSNEHFRFNVYVDNDKVVGILCYWVFENYLYIEHFAIDKQSHGCGYGSLLLKELETQHALPVILEIEPIEDEMTQRRLSFYERLGYKRNSFLHKLICYQGDVHHDMNLIIMTSSSEISQELYDKFYVDFCTIIMADI